MFLNKVHHIHFMVLKSFLVLSLYSCLLVLLCLNFKSKKLFFIIHFNKYSFKLYFFLKIILIFSYFFSLFIFYFLGVVLMYVIRIDLNDQYKQRKLDYIDNCVICLLFILVIF